MKFLFSLGLAALLLKGCSPAAQAPVGVAAQSLPLAPQSAECAVTQPPDPPFVPPAPNSAPPAYGDEFWYGTPELFTRLLFSGTWNNLPHTETGYTQKVAWWREGYDWQAEPLPNLVVTGKRLDAPAPPLVASRATNGYESELKSFMLVGVDIPTEGCWEITGEYGGHTLSFVVRVEP